MAAMKLEQERDIETTNESERERREGFAKLPETLLIWREH